MNQNPDDDEADADEEDGNIIEILRGKRYDGICSTFYMLHFIDKSERKFAERIRKN